MHACRFSLSLSLSLSHARIYSYHVLGCRFSLSYTKIHARAFSLTSHHTHTHTHTLAAVCMHTHLLPCACAWLWLCVCVCVCVCAGVANTEPPASFLIAFFFDFFFGQEEGRHKNCLHPGVWLTISYKFKLTLKCYLSIS